MKTKYKDGTPVENRAGPWSASDKKYVAENYKTKSAVDIAKAIKRNVDAVRDYIHTHFAVSFTATAKEAEYDIRSSPIWADIQNQFSKEEQKMFLYHWGRTISQFKDDVYPTEQMQVVDCIKLDILMNRSLTEQQKCMNEIKYNERLLDDERSKEEMNRDRNYIFSLEKQIAALRAAAESLHTDYRDMLTKKNAMLKEMKATRDARIKNIESYKHSFTGWMVRLFDDKELRKSLGEQMEMMRLAAENEYQRLSEYHQYVDGNVDQPLLTPENIIEENKEGEIQ